MALCSTCGLTGQGSTAPEADSHKQKLCVYRHQATTSQSPAAGGVGTEGGRESRRRRKQTKKQTWIKTQCAIFDAMYSHEIEWKGATLWSLLAQQEGCGFDPMWSLYVLCRFSGFFKRFKDKHVRQTGNSKLVVVWVVCLPMQPGYKPPTCPGCNPAFSQRQLWLAPADPCECRRSIHRKWMNRKSMWISWGYRKSQEKKKTHYKNLFSCTNNQKPHTAMYLHSSKRSIQSEFGDQVEHQKSGSKIRAACCSQCN